MSGKCEWPGCRRKALVPYRFTLGLQEGVVHLWLCARHAEPLAEFVEASGKKLSKRRAWERGRTSRPMDAAKVAQG